MEEQRHYQVVQDWQLTLQGKQIHGKPSCNVDRLQVTGAKVVGKNQQKKPNAQTSGGYLMRQICDTSLYNKNAQTNKQTKMHKEVVVTL